MNTHAWFVSCPRGLEALLLQELNALGVPDARETVAGCSFEGTWADAYRTALWSRLANRVLAVLGDVPVAANGHPGPGLADLDWGSWLPDGASFMVDFSGRSDGVRNTQYGAQLVKDAIVDYCRDRGRVRPQVEKKSPDVRFQARLRPRSLTVSVDIVGASLHQRGYRLDAGPAPIKENLAAALLLRADWPGIAARGGAFIDPLCGAGTLLIEAAMMAADIAPGLGRERWSFERLPAHNAAQWRAIVSDAKSRAEKGRSAQLPEIRGYDASPRAVEKAEANIHRLGLEDFVRVSCKPLKALKQPTHKVLGTGLLLSNPPYGERLGEVEDLRELYQTWGDRFLSEFPGWRGGLLTPEKELGMATGLRSHKRYALFNGALPCTLLLFESEPGQRLVERKPLEIGPQATLTPGAEMFANRLRKNLRQLKRWSTREGHVCYRLYDADMPEYAVAIDSYEGHLHVAEYRAPSGVDEAGAAKRREEIKQALCAVFEVEPQDVAWKLRQRQRGAGQYQRQDARGEFLTVREGQAKLRVNLHDYLDTGLFLDHRPLRLRLAEQAKGKDFLNLFCYTAVASVHAGVAGARSTTSVDLSNTYLDWARDNFKLNGLGEKRNSLVRADCVEWLAQCREQYDLILLDPPSFSNSKRMEEDFDVQRDHLALLRQCMKRLRPEGELFFSNNLRSFKLAAELEAEFSVRDISQQTIDVDFKRNPRIHRCWHFTH